MHSVLRAAGSQRAQPAQFSGAARDLIDVGLPMAILAGAGKLTAVLA